MVTQAWKDKGRWAAEGLTQMDDADADDCLERKAGTSAAHHRAAPAPL